MLPRKLLIVTGVASLAALVISACSSGESERQQAIKSACSASLWAVDELDRPLATGDLDAIGQVLWLVMPDLVYASRALREVSSDEYDAAGELASNIDQVIIYGTRFAARAMSSEAATLDDSLDGEYEPLPSPNEWNVAATWIRRVCSRTAG